MAVKPRGNGWQVDIRCPEAGRLRVQFDDEGDAKEWETRAKECIRAGRKVPPRTNCKSDGHTIVTLKELLRHVSRHRWANTKAAKTQIKAAETVVNFIGPDIRVDQVQVSKIHEFVEYYQDRGLTNATINRKLSGISVLMREAEDIGVIKKAPKIKRYKEYEGRLRFLTRDEAQRLLEKLTFLGAEDVRKFCMVAMDTGMRRGELLKLRWADFSEDFRRVTVWETKADEPRTLKLTKRSREALFQFHESGECPKGPFERLRLQGEPGMPGYYLRSIFERAVHLLGWDDVVIHTLRHTCASWLVQGGKDLRRVQKWMGHKTINTTLRYAHLAPSDLDECADTLEREETKVKTALLEVA